MKKMLLIFVIINISFAALVSTKDTSSDASGDSFVTYFDNTDATAGKLLYAFVTGYGGNADITITDSLGNSWQLVDSIYSATGSYKVVALYAKKCVVGMNKITATYSTARTYRRMILAQYSNIDTTSPLLDSVAIGMAVPAGTNTFYSDSLWASDTCIAIMAAQEASCENFQITAGDYFTLRDSTAVGYDAYIQDSTIETAGDSIRGQMSTAACDNSYMQGVFALFKHLESGGAGCTNPVIPNVGVSDTIGDTIWYHHIATLNDFDSIEVAVTPGGDTAWAVNYDANDSIAYIPRHTGVDKILKLVWYACETSDTVYDTIDVIWDTLKVDSVEYVPSGDRMNDGDSMYTDDTLDIKGNYPGISGFTVPAYLTKEDSSETALRVIVDEMTGDSIGAKFVFGICDTVSCDTLADSLIYAGNVPDPTVTDNPNDSTVDISGTYSIFIACYTPRGTNTFQWQDSTGLGWANITGETDSTFDTVAVYAMNGFKYRCIVSNNRSSGPDTSTVSTLTVNASQFTIDTSYSTGCQITTPHASLMFDSTSICTLIVTLASGYAVIWPGGTVYYSDVDTLTITVTEDSTVTATAYLIPVIDSIRLKNPPLRDSTYTYSARNNDTVIIYCNELYAEGDSSKVWQNSSGSSVFTVVTWDNDGDSIVAIPAASSPRGYYKSRVMNQYEIISTTPASPNFRIKVPSIGSP